MGFFKDMGNTVKNIFNTEDDLIFEQENEFEEKNNGGGLPKFPNFFDKKNNSKNDNKSPLPSFDALNHDFNFAQNNTIPKKKQGNGKIQIYVPKNFEEAFNIIKDVRNGYTAMVNVEVANPQIAQRIIDLISGALYVLDGECKKMGEKQYIFSLSAETIGAYDYLPVNGGTPNQQPQQQQGFGFPGIPSMPFNFNNMGQGMGFQNSFQNQNMNFNQQQNQGQFINNGFQNNQFKPEKSQNVNVDMKSFYVPPQSQF